MGSQLSPPDLALYQATDEVLHYVWDPIGVATEPRARDEYHAYLPQVFALLREGETAIAIANYLSAVRTERIGLPSRPERDLEIAELLVEWKQVIAERYA